MTHLEAERHGCLRNSDGEGTNLEISFEHLHVA